jgi:hypothetical protein
MANSLGLNDDQESVLAEIIKADGADFSVLVSVAGLDPSVDFRAADLRGVDFGHSDLDGFDFSDADLSGCRFDRANLKGAIFMNNRDEGTVWPRPPSERRPSRAVLRATTDYVLRSYQSEALSTIVAALIQGIERPVVLMPPGTGRAILLEALLSELDKREMLGVALVYAPTQSSVEQLRHRFSHSFGSDAVARSKFKDTEAPFDARVIVAGISSLRTETSQYSPTLTFSDVTHIFIFDSVPTSSRLHDLTSRYPGVQIVSFPVSRLTAEVNRAQLIQGGEIVFELTYRQAVREELLEPAEIHDYPSPGSVEHAEDEEMRLIVSELLEVLRRMPVDAVGGIVCRNRASVQKLARALHDASGDHPRSRTGIQRVVQHTSPSADESLVRAALDLPGTVLLMNDVVASGFDWAVLDYAIVLARLRSPEHLAFVRRRPGRKQGLQVIDYMQNFDWIAPGRGWTGSGPTPG